MTGTLSVFSAISRGKGSAFGQVLAPKQLVSRTATCWLETCKFNFSLKIRQYSVDILPSNFHLLSTLHFVCKQTDLCLQITLRLRGSGPVPCPTHHALPSFIEPVPEPGDSSYSYYCNDII